MRDCNSFTKQGQNVTILKYKIRLSPKLTSHSCLNGIFVSEDAKPGIKSQILICEKR